MGGSATGSLGVRMVVLDSEAVQALADLRHAKHRTVIAHLEAIATRRRRGGPTAALVPTAVRVEAWWDRTQPASAAINRFRVQDHPLDTPTGDLAAAVNIETGAGVADSHIGATIRQLPEQDEVVVLTSDPDDMIAVSGDRSIRAVAL